jgi:ribosomal protein S18 acetylase RimI-like enzyme
MLISYRKATIQDAASIASVHCQSWRETYQGVVPAPMIESWANEEKRTKSWKDNFAAGNQHVWVAHLGEKIIGYASAGAANVSNNQLDGEPTFTGQLFALYLIQAAKRQGIGQALVKLALADLRSAGHQHIRVEVLKGNEPAIAFYKNLGAQFVREATFEMSGQALAEFVYGWRSG